MLKYSKMESWKSGSFRPADRHMQACHLSPNSQRDALRDSRWSHLYQSGCGSPPSPSSGSPSARPSPCSSPQSPSACCTQTQRQVRRGRGDGEGEGLRLSLFDLSPLQVDVGSLDLTQLLLNQLFGSDLRIQCRLQLQPGRHVQLLTATHLPQGVLQGATKSRHPSSVQHPFPFLCACRRSSAQQPAGQPLHLREAVRGRSLPTGGNRRGSRPIRAAHKL